MILAERMKTIEDEELFELFRETTTDYVTLIKEIISRQQAGKLSPALWDEFVSMQMNCMASIVDTERKPTDKKALLKAVEAMINVVCDDKR